MTPELINELVAVLCDDLYIEVHTAERYPPMVAFVGVARGLPAWLCPCPVVGTAPSRRVYAPSLARRATMKIAN